MRFTTAAELLMMLIEAKRTGELQRRFRSFERVELLLIDELGYIPFEREATDAFQHHLRSLRTREHRTYDQLGIRTMDANLSRRDGCSRRD